MWQRSRRRSARRGRTGLAPAVASRRAPNGRAALAFASGTSALLGESSDLTVDGDEAMQVLRLAAGSVDLHVAKVSADRRFLVTTPDAEVEVRGTKFRVAIGPADPSCLEDALTHLVVTEGAVVVRHAGVEKRVGAGEQWPSDCIPPVEISAPMPSAAPADHGLGRVDARRAERPLRRGHRRQAERGEPGAPSRPSTASSRRIRRAPSRRAPPSSACASCAPCSRRASSTAARQYLARYPNGFASAEAEAIVSGPR